MYTRSEIWKTVDEIIWKEVHSYERKFILSTIDDSFKVLTSFDDISFSANNVYTLRDLKNSYDVTIQLKSLLLFNSWDFKKNEIRILWIDIWIERVD